MFLALDYGERWIGVAATDVDGKIPYRYGVIDQKKEPGLAAIVSIIEKERVKKVLVGMPRNLQGEDTQQTITTAAFLQALAAALPEGVSVEEVDEVLTSHEARQNIQAEFGKPEDEHAEAARLLLEDYLR